MSTTVWCATAMHKPLQSRSTGSISDRMLAELLGNEAHQTVEKLRIDWDNVVNHLLG